MSAPQPARTEAGAALAGKKLIITLICLALAVIGHALIVDWRPSPGGKPWLLPIIASVIVLGCALLLALNRRRKGSASGVDQAVAPAAGARDIALTTLLTALWGLGFFHAVQALGLLSASVLFTAIGMLALSPEPRRALRVILPLAIVVAGSFWLMFTQLAPIMISDPLLW